MNLRLALLRRSVLVYRIGMGLLILAWPLLIVTGALGLSTWPAAGLGIGGAGIALGGVLLDIVRTELDVS